MSEDALHKTFSTRDQVADPGGTGAVGKAAGYDFAKSAIGNPELIFITRDGAREVTLQADVFLDHLHLHCPVCRLDGHEHGLRINVGTKDWLYEPDKQVKKFPGWDEAQMMFKFPKGSGGRLSVDKFTCSWCKSVLAIDRNVVRLA